MFGNTEIRSEIVQATPSFSRCIASIESKQIAFVHLELAEGRMIVARSGAWAEALEALGIPQGRRMGDTSWDR